MRIIGGDNADRHEFGYTVSLEDDIGHFCGATLIRPDIVLSAAHCGGGDMYARVGAHNISGNEGTRIKVKEQIKHKSYHADTTNYDFMILVLDEPAPASTPLARLHEREDLRDGDSLTVIGWGNMNPGYGWDMPDIKQHVEVKYIETDDCNRQGSYNGEISNAMMCAGESEGGEDACQGDSGGPLVRLNSNGFDELVGVVSWGYGCANAKYPGVYSRITAVDTWIKDMIEDWSEFPLDEEDDVSEPETTTTVPTEEINNLIYTNHSENWRSVLEEHFDSDFGQNSMVSGGNHVRQYPSAFLRTGVARIQHGKGEQSSFSTKELSTQRSVSHHWKVTTEFLGNKMEENEDRYCIQYREDLGSWKDVKCYMSGVDFVNGEWMIDPATFIVKGTTEYVHVRWICEGNDTQDDVLIDKIKIEAEV